MSYSDKLQHPKWQRVRLKIMERDDFKCRICGRNDTLLHVHHTVYLKGHEPWEYDDNFLLTLCTPHHDDEEKLKSEDLMIVTQLLTAGVTRSEMLHLSVQLRRYIFSGENKFGKLMDFLNE